MSDTSQAFLPPVDVAVVQSLMMLSVMVDPATMSSSQTTPLSIKSELLSNVQDCSQPLPPNAEGTSSTAPTANLLWSHPKDLKVATYDESLKYNKTDDARYAPKTRRSDEENKPIKRRKTKRLSFDERVEVVPIPMRTEYSTRIRSRIWSSATDIHMNAVRNSIEFASENWNWRNCLEDDDMCVSLTTSELIHPIHLANAVPHGFR